MYTLWKSLEIKGFLGTGGMHWYQIIGAKVSGRKRTIDILGIGRVSMVQGKSVHGSGQECLWFRARMSIVQARMSIVRVVECPSYRTRVSIVQGKKDRILINCNLPVHNPDTQIRIESCMIQNFTYGSARGAQQ
jgi:hypothetical protein